MMKKNKWWAFTSIILCSILVSMGMIFWKIGAEKLTNFSLFQIITNIPIMIGFLCYILGAILLIIALKGGELSVIHPFLSLGYVFVAIASPIIFKEVIGLTRIIGISSIVIGVIAIGYGSK